MKIICSKNELLKGINIVSKAVPARTNMSILECILFDATTDQIKLSANDMEIGIETIIEGRIEEKGSYALDAKFISESIRKLADNDVTINIDENFKATISCENTNYEITAKSADLFTKIPVIPRNEPLMISQFSFRELIRQTAFTIGDEKNIKNNKMMLGELVEIKNDTLKMVALDTSRISIRNIKLKESYPDKKVVVPGKTLKELGKIIVGGVEDMMEIFFTDNHIIFEFENTVVVSRLIEGEYFKIDQMVSNDCKTKVKVNKKNLLDGIDRSTPVIGTEGEKKPLVMDVNGNSMKLHMDTAYGRMEDNINIEKDGQDLSIGFNAKYFIEALRVIDDEEVILHMTDHRSPCFIKDEEESYIYFILPVLQD